MSTVTDTETVTFIAKCPNLVIVKEPRFPKFNALGLKYGQHPGVRAEFNKSQFSTDDPEMIEFLREHPGYNVAGVTGFWELGRAPNEPKPSVHDQQAAIEAAVDARDVDALQSVIELEDETHKRDVVYASARIALRALAGDGGADSPDAD